MKVWNVIIVTLLLCLTVPSLGAQETTYQRVQRTHSITFVAGRLNMPWSSDRDTLAGIDVELARLVVGSVVKFYKGEKTDKIIHTPAVLITSDNVESYYDPDALF